MKNVGAPDSRQGMRGRTGGRPGGMESMTEEQRERFSQMRQQRQTVGDGTNPTEVSKPQQNTNENTDDTNVAEVKEDKEEDDWGALFGELIEETPSPPSIGR